MAGQAPFSRRTKEILSTGQPRLEGEDLSEWREIVLAEDPASEKMALLAPDFLELHVKEQELSWAEIGTEAFVARWIASKGAHFLEID